MRKIVSLLAIGLCLYGSASAMPATGPNVRTHTMFSATPYMSLEVRLTDVTPGRVSILRCTVRAPGAQETTVSFCTVTSAGGGKITASPGSASGSSVTTYGVGRLGAGGRTACIVGSARFANNVFRSVSWCAPMA